MSATWDVIDGTLVGAVGPAVSVLFATYGETIVERAGRINLGVEGSMLMGACFGFIATLSSGNVVLGVLIGMLAGSALSLLYAYLIISRRTNQLATGIAISLFGAGITAWAGRAFVGQSLGGLNPIPVPGLSHLPVLGDALFRQDALTYAAYLLGPALWLFLNNTRLGLGLRAVGENSDVAYAAGRNPRLVQYAAIAAGGALAGLGGTQLSLALTHSWSEGMTVGRGYIAVALVIFGLWNPIRAMAGAVLFGGAIALELQLEAKGAPVSPFFLAMLPYLVTVGVLAIWAGTALKAMPNGLTGVLKRGS